MPETGTAPCPECAAPSRTTGQSFCDSCGAFLRWDTGGGARGTRGAQDAPAGAAAGTAADRAEAATAPLPAVPEAAERAGRTDREQPAERPEPGTGSTESAPDLSSAGAARALLVPVPEASGDEPEPGGRPGTVLPGRPEAARPRVRTPQPARAAQEGPPCPACGTPNAPQRSFCRDCATALGERRADPESSPYAGQRPALHRERRRWIVRAVVVSAVALVVVGGLIGGPPAARAVQDHFAKRVAVRPTGWTASHSAEGHGPEQAFDSYSNTWWGTGYAGDSNGQHLQADFAQPMDLLAVLVTPGTSKRPGKAADQARPQELDLIVTDSAGRTRTTHKTLDDGGVQRIDIRRRNTVSVRIVLRSAYGSGPDRQVAVAEIEFFGRSRG